MVYEIKDSYARVVCGIKVPHSISILVAVVVTISTCREKHDVDIKVAMERFY